MPYEKRWEKVGDEPIGIGGQGTVYLVRDKRLVPGRNELETKLRDAIRGVTSGTNLEQRLPAYDEFRECVQYIQKADELKNLAALKVLHKLDDAPHPENAEERIRREIAAMVNAGDHPNLLRIIDFDLDSKWHVSEYHPNGHLHKQANVDRFKGDFPAALKAIRPLVAAVSGLHNDGVVHRDIKPENILAAGDSRLVLGDFGLVFFTDATHKRVSETFENVGSWQWMPQWAIGTRVDEVRTQFDVHCFGKTLWSMVSGERFLRLWYFDRAEFDVLEMFPNSPFIELANPLFAQCITEDEGDCLPNANALLDEIDETLRMIDRGGELLSVDATRPCRVCGKGHYKIKADQRPHETQEFGLRPSGSQSFKVFVCDNCGHVQLFSFDGSDDLPAWFD